MGLLDFIKGKNSKYVKEVTVFDPPGQHMRIIKDSMEIMMKTVNPETFFSREKLASNEALYCEREPVIIWNGMTGKQIYQMLNEKELRDKWHRDFLDRLFEKGCEDNLSYDMWEGRHLSKDNLNYFLQKLNGKKYHFCIVKFPGSDKLYTYIAKDMSIQPSDSVTIPIGKNKDFPESKLTQVVDVYDMSLDDLTFPVTDLRCVEEKLKSITCPHCGASIEINVGQKTGRCLYCRAEFYLI